MTTLATETATRMFKILAADALAPEGLDYLRAAHDAELVDRPGLSEDEYAAIIGEHDAMIVRSGIQVTARMLANPGRLKVIARAGVGVDNIDLETATQKGILVVNAAEASTLTTAEHAFALLLAMLRNVGPASRCMAEGGWDRSRFQGRQLAGKTLGVVGFGRIGQALARRALAFEANVIGFDPLVNAETMLKGRVRMYRSFTELLPDVDILSFHVPLNDATRGMLNAEAFGQCRPGVQVVNVARGGVVDEDDLLQALDSGQCGGAALDVYSVEPLPADHPLRRHPKVLLSPHLGASTQEAQQAVSIDAAAAALAYLRGERIRGAVNAGGLKIDLSSMQRRYSDLGTRMARLISPMITRGIAEVGITICGEHLGAAQSMIERSALCGLLCEHLSEPVNIINVNQVAESRGIRVRTSVVSEGHAADQLELEVTGPRPDRSPPPPDLTRRIVGRVYDDLKPRVVEINGYHMDMVPAGEMILIQNEDKPGIIGLVGTAMGRAGVNIADMSISRREAGGDVTAMMVLKIDGPASRAQLGHIETQPGILKVAAVRLPAETP